MTRRLYNSVRLRVLTLVLLLAAPAVAGSSTGGQNGGNQRGADDQPLLAPVVVQSNLTAEQAFPKIFFTGTIATSFPDVLQPDSDVAWEDARIRRDVMNGTGQFANLKNIPNSRKIDRDVHYELGDPRITQLTIDQVKAGYARVMRATDFNTVFKLDGNDDTTADFNRLVKENKWQDNDKAREVKRILQECDGQYGIYGSDASYQAAKAKGSLPRLVITGLKVYQRKGEDDMIPILHNKEWVDSYLDDKGTEIPVIGSLGEVNYTLPSNVHFDSSGKATVESRINASTLIAEPHLLQNMIAHTDALFDALGEGKEINEIQSVSPVEVHLADGGMVRLYYTDGKYNPNHLQDDIMNDAIATLKTKKGIPLDPQDPPAKRNIELDEIQDRQFVFSYRPDLLNLEQYFALKPPTQYLALFDNSFAKGDGQGFAPIFSGFAIDRPFGGHLRDFQHVFTGDNHVYTYVYQRGIPGLTRTNDDDGPSDVYISHGKSKVVAGRIGGVPTTIIHFGSFNWSGHAANSESRLYMELPSGSRYAQAHREIVRKVIQHDVKLGYAVPGLSAMTRNNLADLTEHLTLEIPLQKVKEFLQLISKAEKTTAPADIISSYRAVLSKLNEIDSMSTGSVHKLNPDQFAARIKQLDDFVVWYSALSRDQSNVKYGNGLDAPKFFAIAAHIMYPSEVPQDIRNDLDFALYEKNLTAEQLEQRLNDAWKVLGITQPLPPSNLHRPLKMGTPSNCNSLLSKIG